MWDVISHNQHKPGPAHSTSGPDAYHSAPPVFHSSVSPNAPSLASLIDHAYMHIIFVIIHILVKPQFQKKEIYMFHRH